MIDKDFSREHLEKLSTNSDYSIRCKVAENSHTPSYVLENLSRDVHPTVRFCVASNKNTSISVLERLSNDEESGIRTQVAQNLNTSTSTLYKLSGDLDWFVRYYVANNLNTSSFGLENLSRDKTARIRASAIHNSSNIRLRKIMNVGIITNLEFKHKQFAYYAGRDLEWLKGWENRLFEIVKVET